MLQEAIVKIIVSYQSSSSPSLVGLTTVESEIKVAAVGWRFFKPSLASTLSTVPSLFSIDDELTFLRKSNTETLLRISELFAALNDTRPWNTSSELNTSRKVVVRLKAIWDVKLSSDTRDEMLSEEIKFDASFVANWSTTLEKWRDEASRVLSVARIVGEV